MYPGPADPDFGIFVADLARELERRGHELEYAVVDGRGGSRAKYVRLGADAVFPTLRAAVEACESRPAIANPVPASTRQAVR